jgi:hypothetical protein
MNKLREKKEEQQSKPKRKKKQNILARSFVSLFSGSFLTREETLRQLPFLFFLAFLGLLYIGNGYYAERTVRKINKVGTEIKELKSEFITTSSELMFLSKQSEVARAALPLGLKQSVVPPKKIISTEIPETDNGN